MRTADAVTASWLVCAASMVYAAMPLLPVALLTWLATAALAAGSPLAASWRLDACPA